MPFQDIGLVVAFILEHYKMVISKNIGVDKIREFFAEREVVEVSLPEETVSQLDDFNSSMRYNGKILNLALATAMSTPPDHEDHMGAVKHAHKGLYGMMETIWVPVVSNMLVENKAVQHLKYQVKLDEMTNLSFEAYVLSFNTCYLILVGVGVAFNESFAVPDYLIYYPSIVFHDKEGVSEELTEVGRSRLDTIYETIDQQDLLGMLVAFEKAMKVSTYS